MAKNLPASAEESHSIPGLGRPHMQRGNRALSATEACMPRACAPAQEKPAHRNLRVPPAHCNWREPTCSNNAAHMQPTPSAIRNQHNKGPNPGLPHCRQIPAGPQGKPDRNTGLEVQTISHSSSVPMPCPPFSSFSSVMLEAETWWPIE